MKKNMWIISTCVVVIAVLMFGLWYRKMQLAEEYNKRGEEIWSSWFEPTSESMDKAIEEWNMAGIVSFCEREDIDEIMPIIKEEFFCVEDGVLAIKKGKGIWIGGGMEEYTDEEKKNAMLLIMYGKNGLPMGNKVYVSSYDSVTDINPYLFNACIVRLNERIATEQGDSSLRTWWRRKIRKS